MSNHGSYSESCIGGYINPAKSVWGDGGNAPKKVPAVQLVISALGQNAEDLSMEVDRLTDRLVGVVRSVQPIGPEVATQKPGFGVPLADSIAQHNAAIARTIDRLKALSDSLEV